MNILLHCILLAVLLSPLSCLAEQCAGGSEIVDPEPFQWEFVDGAEPHYVGTMEIAEAELTLGGDTIHTRVYRQQGGCDSIPGPTLNMVPGEKYVLRFRNRLPYEPRSDDHNVFKDPNVSNLHTHGVHISGTSPGDDVTRSFEGGAGGDFVYDIPEDHMGGTFWYHAHHHGSTYLQVSGGAFGLIVLDDSGDSIPPAVAAMEERQLVVAYLDPDVAGTGGDTLISGNLSPTWTVNGSIDGTLVVPPGTWQHWRVLLADRDARAKTFSIGPQCEVALMARDGVWRTEVPKTLLNNAIRLTGASRADLAVRCGSDSILSVGDTTVARVRVEGDADPAPNPYGTNGETWWSARPGYLRDLRNTVPADAHSIIMGATTINGRKYDPQAPTFTLNADGVQQFELMGASNHPFHMHIYHVQVQGSCGEYEDGEYYDVISENCSVRFDLSPASSSPYSGRTIMHCHVLKHEDLGAMGWVDVVGGQGAPAFPADSSYIEYIEPVLNPADYSGPWFDPDLDGEGYLIFNTPVGWLVYYFGYSASGDRLWLVSNIVEVGEPVLGQDYEFSMLVGTPGSFETPTPSADLESWGTLWINLTNCFAGVFTMDGGDGMKVANVQKIVGIEGVSCGAQ